MKKCIIRQDWTTYEADTWRMLDRRSFVYVTNEDGTPHIYDSIKEARAEIAANYGTEPNSRGILYNHTKDVLGNDHWSTVTIVREGTDEYAKATGTEATETAAKAYTIICTTKANRTEYLHAVTVEAANVTEAKKVAAKTIRDTLNRHAFALSNEGTKDANNLVSFCADRWNMTAAAVVEAARAPQGIDMYGADPAQIVAEAMNEATEAMEEAREAERKTADAATDYDPETAAKHAADAEHAAKKAEDAAKKAAAAARMSGASSITCSTADIVSELAYYARRDANSATETAKQSAEEAKSIKDVDAYTHDAKAYANATAWTLDKMNDHTEDPAYLARFARTCADHAKDAADKAAASFEYARHTCYADHEINAYAARALAIRAEQRDDAQQEAQRAEETAQKIEALAADAAADNAARDLLNAYAETIGAPADAEETEAAHRVARYDIAHRLGSTRADRETVDLMTDIVARNARRPDLTKYAGMKYLTLTA